MFFILFILLPILAAVIPFYAFQKKKTNELSQIGQFLQGLAAIMALGVAIHSGEEILHKIDSLITVTKKIDNLVERIDRNIAEIRAPKDIVDEQPKNEEERTELLERKRQFWTTAIEKIENDSFNPLKIENKNLLIQSLVNTKTSDEAAKVLEGNVRFHDPTSKTNGIPAKVNKIPSDGSFVFTFSK